jgi:translation initiation factor 3 subunit M
MPGARNTILIEGTFEELVDEFAQYIDTLKKGQGDEESNLQGETADLLKENKKDDVLKKLVVGGQALNQAPEKGRRDCRDDRLMANKAGQSSSRPTTC